MVRTEQNETAPIAKHFGAARSLDDVSALDNRAELIVFSDGVAKVEGGGDWLEDCVARALKTSLMLHHHTSLS